MKMAEIGMDLHEMVDLLNDNVETRWELIGPAEARKYLEKNTDNYRKPSSFNIVSYANDIQNGTWEINGETIVFDEHGNLRNGQHRLLAIIKAGKPLITLVVHKLPNTNLYDMGKKRAEIDYLKSIGFDTMSNLTVGTVNFMIMGFNRGNSGRKNYSHGIIEKVVSENADLLTESCGIVRRGTTNPITRKAPIHACVFCILKNQMIPAITLDKMLQIVNSGISQSGYESSPALALRMTIMDCDTKKYDGTIKKLLFDATYQAALDFSKGFVRKKKYTLTTKSDKLFESTRAQLGIE